MKPQLRQLKAPDPKKYHCADSAHASRNDCIADLHKFMQRDEWPEGLIDQSINSLIRSTPCLAFRLKAVITRLRRGNKRTDWRFFKKLVNRHLEFWLSEADSRTLVSILDTYIDHGSIKERKNALIAVSMVSYEKLVQTKESLFTLTRKAEDTVAENVPLWSGLNGFSLESGDMPRNLFRRYSEALSDTPTIRQLFSRIMKDMIDAESSTMSILAERSREDVSFLQTYLKFLCHQEPDHTK